MLQKMELSWEYLTNFWVILPEVAIDIAVLLMSGAGLCIAVHVCNPFTAMPQYWDFNFMASHLSTKAKF
jgi:hypothetical protein